MIVYKYDFGLLSQLVPVLMYEEYRPACEEISDNLGDESPFRTCADIGKMEDQETYCKMKKFQRKCRATCKVCVEDSTVPFILKRTCDVLQEASHQKANNILPMEMHQVILFRDKQTYFGYFKWSKSNKVDWLPNDIQ